MLLKARFSKHYDLSSDKKLSHSTWISVVLHNTALAAFPLNHRFKKPVRGCHAYILR